MNTRTLAILRHVSVGLLAAAPAVVSATACSGSTSAGALGAGRVDAGASGSSNGGTTNDGSPAGGGNAGGGNAGDGNAGADAALLAACASATPFFEAKTTCHSDSDCAPTSGCMHWKGPAQWPSDFGYAGGACFATVENCTLDSNCTADMICADVYETIPPPPYAFMAEPTVCLVRKECQAKCTATSCSADEDCDPNGHCFPRLCTAGFTCAEGKLCDLSRTDSDAHGCAVARCVEDAYTCPAGSKCKPQVPNCGFEGPCPPRPDAHGCLNDLCTDGYACAPNYDCSSTPTPSPFPLPPGSDDGHGCVRRTCTSDSQCDCGGCVNGKCEDRLFVCREDPPFSVGYYPDGSDGNVEVVYSTHWSGQKELDPNFYAGAQFQDHSPSSNSNGGHLVGLDQLSGVDDCSFNTAVGGSGTGSLKFHWFGEAWIIDGAQQIPFDAPSQGQINFGVDLAARGATPRFGGTYGFRAQGGDLPMPISIDGITLPSALAIPELETKRTLGRGDQKLTWTGAENGLLYVSMNFFPMYAESWPVTYNAYCVLNDDGEFTLPAALLAQVPSDGFVEMYFQREKMSSVDTGGRKIAARGTVTRQHSMSFGKICDRPDVVSACAAHAAAVRAVYQACNVTPPPDDQTCPDYLVESCRACPEYYDCLTQNLKCEAGSLTYYSGNCACP